jgi:hypothetical protein
LGQSITQAKKPESSFIRSINNSKLRANTSRLILSDLLKETRFISKWMQRIRVAGMETKQMNAGMAMSCITQEIPKEVGSGCTL